MRLNTPLARILVLAALLLSSTQVMAAGTKHDATFDFSVYGGEGTYMLFRLEVNIKKRKGRLCFIHSGMLQRAPEGLAALVYEGKAWTGQFDAESWNRQNKVCEPVQFTGVTDAFSSNRPLAHDGYQYQFFFVGALDQITYEDRPVRVLRGEFNLFSQTLIPGVGSTIYFEKIPVLAHSPIR